ncbi:hypothetical protein B0H13DRAFT_2373053 [Mycena leptocephala]|nr:hypothetical protein B0H13DRAFT_2373053 [Mycena leptocephala]
MTKPQAGNNGIGYRHLDTITIDVHPPYLPCQEIPAGLKAQVKFLEPHVSSDGNKYKPLVSKSLANQLSERIIIGGLKKLNGVKQKLSDILVIYKGVNYLKTRSSGDWDDYFGANVITQTEADVWESLILLQPKCTPFYNQGWPLYLFFEQLDPAKPKGHNLYHPCIGMVGNDVVVPGAALQASARSQSQSSASL